MTRAREAEEATRVASIEADAAARVESLQVMVARVEAQTAAGYERQRRWPELQQLGYERQRRWPELQQQGYERQRRRPELQA